MIRVIMFQGNMFRLKRFVIELFTSDVRLKHVSCMVVRFMLFHGPSINFLHFSGRMVLEITATVAFILWFSVNFQALQRRRRAMQLLTRRRHLRFLQYKIFSF